MVNRLNSLHPGQGQANTPFGPCLIGWDADGIFFLHFYDRNLREVRALLDQMIQDDISVKTRNDDQAQVLANQIFDLEQPKLAPRASLHGTPFQLKVWKALQQIPAGKILSYGALAEKLGQPGAARAVGSAIAANQVGFLVPCHRVVRASGESGQYRWGSERKANMIEWEANALAK